MEYEKAQVEFLIQCAETLTNGYEFVNGDDDGGDVQCDASALQHAVLMIRNRCPNCCNSLSAREEEE